MESFIATENPFCEIGPRDFRQGAISPTIFRS